MREGVEVNCLSAYWGQLDRTATLSMALGALSSKAGEMNVEETKNIIVLQGLAP